MANLTNPGNYQLAALGQLGSTLINVAASTVTPPSGKAFVAITMLADTTFDTTTGLVAADGSTWAGTATSSTGSGTGGGTLVVGQSFPKGLTIYGRYTSVSIATGSCIAYVG
jgi:hypothetical protein